MFLNLEHVTKTYGYGSNALRAMDDICVDIKEKEMCVILGPSGAGKSTFLNAIGGLEKVDEGKITIENMEITRLNNKKLSEYRRKYLGFVFQFYNLISNLTVDENIEVCEYLTDKPLDKDELIDTLGLKAQKDKLPHQLSGGQQQRCAIARALIKNPKILLCDEPTGALPSKASKEILILLEKINKKYGTTILIVTHNELISKMVNRIIRINDGKIIKNEINAAPIAAADIEL